MRKKDDKIYCLIIKINCIIFETLICTQEQVTGLATEVVGVWEWPWAWIPWWWAWATPTSSTLQGPPNPSRAESNPWPTKTSTPLRTPTSLSPASKSRRWASPPTCAPSSGAASSSFLSSSCAWTGGSAAPTQSTTSPKQSTTVWADSPGAALPTWP